MSEADEKDWNEGYDCGAKAERLRTKKEIDAFFLEEHGTFFDRLKENLKKHLEAKK